MPYGLLTTQSEAIGIAMVFLDTGRKVEKPTFGALYILRASAVVGLLYSIVTPGAFDDVRIFILFLFGGVYLFAVWFLHRFVAEGLQLEIDEENVTLSGSRGKWQVPIDSFEQVLVRYDNKVEPWLIVFTADGVNKTFLTGEFDLASIIDALKARLRPEVEFREVRARFMLPLILSHRKFTMTGVLVGLAYVVYEEVVRWL